MLPATASHLQPRLARHQYVDLTVVAGYLEFFVLLGVLAVAGGAMALSTRHANTMVQSIRPTAAVGMSPAGRISTSPDGERHEQYPGPKRHDVQGGAKRTTG
jgi:hypothetical protein